MKKDKCSTKFCRNKPALNYLGKRVCQECWEKICEKQISDEITQERELEDAKEMLQEIEKAKRGSYEGVGNCPYCHAEESIVTYGVGMEGWATECRECGELLDED